MDLPDFWKKIKRLEKIKINFSKQYRSELGHALASFALLSSGFINHCSLCFAKQIPSEVGLYQDDFSDEKSVLTDTKRKTARLLFFASIGLRLPHIQTYIAKNFF